MTERAAGSRMDVHLKVPPEKWCITKKEFLDFVSDVRKCWRSGGIPDSEEWPNKSHNCRKHGPNLYQVNLHYLKPLTLAAGGMSYALMKHPDGLACEVFVSHAWAEGVFELGSHVKRAWPKGLALMNMYCCLLANPQNLDIQALLNKPPIESPFALAMQHASHVLVIPNDTVSIYTRLWCVYEIYLATELKKTCVLPTKPRCSTVRHLMTVTTMLPFLLGGMIGASWVILWKTGWHETSQHAQVLDTCVMISLGLTAFSGTETLLRTFLGCTTYRERTRSFVMRGVNVSMLVLASACSVPFLAFPSGFTSFYDQALHYGVAVGTCFFAVAVSALNNEKELEVTELRKQASWLPFDSLELASCSNPTDQMRIRAAVQGQEEAVVFAVKVLKSAGACTASIRRAYTKGVKMKGAGSWHINWHVVAAVLPWICSATDELANARIWQHCGRLGDPWIYGFSAVIVLAPVSVIAAFRSWRRQGPEMTTRMMKLCMCPAVLSYLLPFLVAAVQGAEEFSRLPLVFRLAHRTVQAQCPSCATWFASVLLRPIMAVLLLCILFLGRRCDGLSHEPDLECVCPPGLEA